MVSKGLRANECEG